MPESEWNALPRETRMEKLGLVKNPFFGVRPRAKEYVEQATARRNQNTLDALASQEDLRNRIMENVREKTETKEKTEIEEVEEDMPELEEDMPELEEEDIED